MSLQTNDFYLRWTTSPAFEQCIHVILRGKPTTINWSTAKESTSININFRISFVFIYFYLLFSRTPFGLIFFRFFGRRVKSNVLWKLFMRDKPDRLIFNNITYLKKIINCHRQIDYSFKFPAIDRSSSFWWYTNYFMVRGQILGQVFQV